MTWEEQLRRMDLRNLDQLERNAQDVHAAGDELHRARAEMALEAIAAERNRRGLAARGHPPAGRGFHDGALFLRVKAAFTARPPSATEAALLRAVAAAPDADTSVIGEQLGWRRGYPVNARFGQMCHVREAWLGQAPPRQERTGRPNYPSLLVEETARKDPEGHMRHNWRLKPEALAALKELNIVH